MFHEKRLSRHDFLTRMAQGAGGLVFAKIAEEHLLSEEVFAAALAANPLPLRLVQTGCVESAMPGARGLAMDHAGRLYAAGDSGVKVFGADGRLLREIGAGEAACCVAADPEGATFVCHRTQVLAYDPDGRLLSTWGKEGKGDCEFGYITGITVSGHTVYVADAGNRRIGRYAVDGDYIDDLEGFHIPSAYFDCAADAGGFLYVGHTAEHRIERYDGNGVLLESWGKFGPSPEDFCGCCNPTNIAVFPDGSVATAEKGIPRIKVYNEFGKMAAYLGPEDLGLTENLSYLKQLPGQEGAALPCHDGWPGMPMTVDAKGRLAVSIPQTKQVRFFEIKQV